MRNRNCVIWVALGVSEYFLCPLLTWNKNAQLEQGEGGGSAVLLATLLGQSVPAPAEPSPSSSRSRSPPPQTASSTVPKGQLAKRRSRRRSLDARVTELVFVLFKKQIPNRAKPPLPPGNRESGSRGAAWRARIKE